MSKARANATGPSVAAPRRQIAPPSASVSVHGMANGTALPPHVLEPSETRTRERFIPITRFALIDRLTVHSAWPEGVADQAHRFFRYLDHWRQQQYNTE